ncbi:MAG: 30S ribosomal protein S14 [Opitutales bacterium]
MAKKSAVARNEKRRRLVSKYAARRAELKRTIADPKTEDEAFFQAQRELALLPRNSAPCRLRNRCSITGRPRAHIRKYGVSRIVFRELASQGMIPGVTKSSW